MIFIYIDTYVYMYHVDYVILIVYNIIPMRKLAPIPCCIIICLGLEYREVTRTCVPLGEAFAVLT